jgi:hypothetical protein
MAAPDSETGLLTLLSSQPSASRCLVYENAPEAGHLVFAGQRAGLDAKLHPAASNQHDMTA